MAESLKQAPKPSPERENVFLNARKLSPPRLWLWPQFHFPSNLLKVLTETANYAQEEIDGENNSKDAQQNGGPDTDAIQDRNRLAFPILG